MSEQLKPLYDKKVDCPICSFAYFTKKIRSRFIKVDKIESDFFTHYKDKELNPIFYEVSVCSNCGYASSDTFSTYFSNNAISLIKTQITANWTGRDFSGVRTIDQAIEVIKLGILSGSLKQEKSIVMAGLCLRLSWLYRLLEDPVQEIRFMRLSLEQYKTSYLQSEYVGTQLTEMRLIYLIGELSRRLGDWDEAVKNFSKVVNHKNRLLETKLVEMAREQWYLVRETIAK